MPKYRLDVEVEWSEIQGLHDTQWDEGYCLYAYIAPDSPEILYIGHTKYSSIRQRKYGNHKVGVYQRILENTGLHKNELRVFRGDVWLEEGKRRSKKLLLQVETLLIHRIRPCGNTAYTRTRSIARLGMWVDCRGDWPHVQCQFRDSESRAEYAIRTHRSASPIYGGSRRYGSPAVRKIVRILKRFGSL